MVVWYERDFHNSSQAQRRPCPSVEGKIRWLKTRAFVRGGRCRREGMNRTDSLRSQYVVGICELPTLVGPVGTVLVVLAVVGSRLSHGALPASSSYGTYSYMQNSHQ